MTGGFTWQALNALVFFYRDVCGEEVVDLEVKMRKLKTRAPVIPNVPEVLAIIGKLEGRYRTMASLQYGVRMACLRFGAGGLAVCGAERQDWHGAHR